MAKQKKISIEMVSAWTERNMQNQNSSIHPFAYRHSVQPCLKLIFQLPAVISLFPRLHRASYLSVVHLFSNRSCIISCHKQLPIKSLSLACILCTLQTSWVLPVFIRSYFVHHNLHSKTRSEVAENSLRNSDLRGKTHNFCSTDQVVVG